MGSGPLSKGGEKKNIVFFGWWWANSRGYPQSPHLILLLVFSDSFSRPARLPSRNVPHAARWVITPEGRSSSSWRSTRCAEHSAKPPLVRRRDLGSRRDGRHCGREFLRALKLIVARSRDLGFSTVLGLAAGNRRGAARISRCGQARSRGGRFRSSDPYYLAAQAVEVNLDHMGRVVPRRHSAIYLHVF